MLRSESQEEAAARASPAARGPPQQQQPGSPPPPPPLTGQALYRLPSLASYLLKEWQPCLWVLTADKLRVYASREDYEQRSNDPAVVKKQVQLLESLQIGELKFKAYGGQSLHHFTIEDRRDGAASAVLKLASADRDALAYLRDSLAARLQEEVRRRIKYTLHTVGNSSGRQHIIDTVVMKERTRAGSAAAAAVTASGSSGTADPAISAAGGQGAAV